MNYPTSAKTIKVAVLRGVLTLQLYRPETRNSINGMLIREVTEVLLQIEPDPSIKVVVIEGLPDHFCTGMDFETFSEADADSFNRHDSKAYYEMLKHFACCSKVIVAKVDGAVNAGGVGLVAASDLVIASEKSNFGLSEALFGLLPACVLPFLIRRVGYQKAQWMTLITQRISSIRAQQIGLVDEVSDNTDDTVRKTLPRLVRLETSTILELKEYMSKLWIIDERTQELAVNKISALIASDKVRSNIRNYVENGKFPWDN